MNPAAQRGGRAQFLIKDIRNAEATFVSKTHLEDGKIKPYKDTIKFQKINFTQFQEARVRDDPDTKGDANAKVLQFKAASPRQRKKMIKKSIDLVRNVQRSKLTEELAKISSQCLNEDLERFATLTRTLSMQFFRGLWRSCKITPELQRRTEIINCVKKLVVWPDDAVGHPLRRAGELHRCAYDAVLAMTGYNQFVNYLRDTATLRIAQERLFDDGALCGSMDKALLCVSHSYMRDSRLVNCYNLFEYHAEIYLDTYSLDIGARVAETHNLANPRPRMPWGQFGDTGGRIACGRFVRLLEQLLFLNQSLDWQGKQASMVGTTKPVKNADGNQSHSGAWLMEHKDFNGELCAELMSMLYRIFHDDDGRKRAKSPMPAFPKFQQNTNNYTFDDIFGPLDSQPPNETDRALENGRCYIRRLVYTSVMSCWFLHSPIALALFQSLETSADMQPFGQNACGTEGPYQFTIDEHPFITHRKFGLDVANGTAQRMSQNLQELVQQGDEGPWPRSPHTLPPSVFTKCGHDEAKQMLGARCMHYLWDHKSGIFGLGLLGVVSVATLVTAGEAVALAGGAAATAAASGSSGGGAGSVAVVASASNMTNVYGTVAASSARAFWYLWRLEKEGVQNATLTFMDTKAENSSWVTRPGFWLSSVLTSSINRALTIRERRGVGIDPKYADPNTVGHLGLTRSGRYTAIIFKGVRWTAGVLAVSSAVWTYYDTMKYKLSKLKKRIANLIQGADEELQQSNVWYRIARGQTDNPLIGESVENSVFHSQTPIGAHAAEITDDLNYESFVGFAYAFNDVSSGAWGFVGQGDAPDEPHSPLATLDAVKVYNLISESLTTVTQPAGAGDGVLYGSFACDETGLAIVGHSASHEQVKKLADLEPLTGEEATDEQLSWILGGDLSLCELALKKVYPTWFRASLHQLIEKK